jgi:H/ACA ribonucleoprotein complex subunit 3
MAGKIRRCPVDGIYTLSAICPVCGEMTGSAHPARFSPEDRFGPFRRRMKQWRI